MGCSPVEDDDCTGELDIGLESTFSLLLPNGNAARVGDSIEGGVKAGGEFVLPVVSEVSIDVDGEVTSSGVDRSKAPSGIASIPGEGC